MEYPANRQADAKKPRERGLYPVNAANAALFGKFELVRRIAIVDQAPATLEEGVADKSIGVQRGLFEHPAGAEQAGTRIHQVQPTQCPAPLVIADMGDWVGVPVGNAAHGVTPGTGTQ